MQELVTMGYISQKELDYAKRYAVKYNCKVGEALLDLGYVNARAMEHYCKRILKF
jgi:hypothetical protein